MVDGLMGAGRGGVFPAAVTCIKFKKNGAQGIYQHTLPFCLAGFPFLEKKNHLVSL